MYTDLSVGVLVGTCLCTPVLLPTYMDVNVAVWQSKDVIIYKNSEEKLEKNSKTPVRHKRCWKKPYKV